MSSLLGWIQEEVEGIPGAVVDRAKTDVSNTATDLWGRLRTDLANAVNQLGAAGTSSVAGAIAPGGSKPLTIPLTHGQAIALLLAAAVAVGGLVYLVARK